MIQAREFLGQAALLRKQIDNIEEDIFRLQTLATNISAALSDMPRSSSPNLQRIETLLVKKADKEKQLAELKVQLQEVTMGIKLEIGLLDDAHQRDVLTLRYLEELPWDDVASEAHMSKNRVLALHSAALDEMNANLSGGDN